MIFYLICKIIINLSLYCNSNFNNFYNKIIKIDTNNIENNSQNNNINLYNNNEPLLIDSLIPRVIYFTKTITLPKIIFQYYYKFN